jgi:hypothetical protein
VVSVEPKKTSPQWFDICFEYDRTKQSFEIILLDYLVPFLERRGNEVKCFHFIHHKGLDLRIFCNESVRMDIDREFKDLKKYKLLKKSPYDNNLSPTVYKPPMGQETYRRPAY